MCSYFYVSTLSTFFYTHCPQSYPHWNLSILRQKIVIHQLIHIIHKLITFLPNYPNRKMRGFIFVYF